MTFPSPNESECLWDEQDTAQFLKSSPSTLRKARMTGGGPPFMKIGSLVRYSPGSVREWCAARARRSTAEQNDQQSLCLSESATQPSVRPAAALGPGWRPGYSAPPRRPRGRPRKVRADDAAADADTSST